GGDRRAAGQHHAQSLSQRVHGRCSAHRVAITGRGGGRRHQLDEALIVDLTGGQHLAALPHDGAAAGTFALVPAIEHRPDRERDRGQVDRGRRHQQRRRGLVAARGQHHAVERIAVKRLDQTQIGQIAVEPGGGALAGFLNRVDRKFQRDAAHFADALADAFGQHEMVAVAGRKVAAGLGDADDRLAAAQFLKADPEVEIALKIERGHVDIVGIVEPCAAAQLCLFGLAGIDAGGNEIGMVGRIGKLLRLQRDAVAHAIDVPVLAQHRAVDESACIELDPRLGGKHFQHPARGPVGQTRQELGRLGQPRVDGEIVVVAARDRQLLVMPVAQGLAHHAPLAKIKGRARHRAQFAGGDQGSIDRRVTGRRNGQHLVHRITRPALARQIEQGVIGHVHNGRLVGFGGKGDGQIARFVQRIGDRRIQRAGIAAVAIGADMAQHHRSHLAGSHAFHLPQLAVEPLAAAMQAVHLVIERELVGLPVQREFAARDPVGIAAHRNAEKGLARLIGPGVGQADDDIRRFAMTVGRHEFLQCGAIGQNACRNPMTIGQRDRLDRAPIGEPAAILAPGRAHGLATGQNRAIAGAAAQIARQHIGHGPPDGAQTAARAPFKAHDEAGGAETALAAMARHHFGLHRAKAVRRAQ
ncbi:hypothetical protein E4T56_gene15533, partial [Termitomyces sp. T112]